MECPSSQLRHYNRRGSAVSHGQRARPTCPPMVALGRRQNDPRFNHRADSNPRQDLSVHSTQTARIHAAPENRRKHLIQAQFSQGYQQSKDQVEPPGSLGTNQTSPRGCPSASGSTCRGPAPCNNRWSCQWGVVYLPIEFRPMDLTPPRVLGVLQG